MRVNKAQVKQTGITLIELMVALLIGAFLLAGVLQIFITNRQSYRLAEGQSQLQENARYALEVLSHDLRLAGYFGCSGVSASNPVVIANAPLIAPSAHLGNAAVVSAPIVTGGEGAATGTFTTPYPALTNSPLNTATIVKNTDAITVQFAESCGGYTTTAMSTVDPTAAISGSHTCGVINLGTGNTAATLGTPLVISDCDTAHIFRASAGTSQNKDAAGTATSVFPAAKSYAAGSEIMRFHSNTYFIRENAGSQPALYRIDNNDHSSVGAVELVEGIENMQITYGVDTDADGSANQYVDAAVSPASPLLNVVSVRIVLTVSTTEDNLTAAERTIDYNGDADFKDHRLSKDFTATIALRNR